MKKIRLGDYCTVSAGGDKPKVFSDTKTSECSVPVLANGIDNEGLVGFTNRASIESNSVTLSARGSTGTPFYRTKPYVPIIRLISVIPDKEYINCQYLYYLLKTRNISGTGSVQSQLTVPMVENITVPIIEDLNEQLKIATYLGNIDKKSLITMTSLPSSNPLPRPSMTTGSCSLIFPMRMAARTSPPAEKWYGMRD